MKRPGSTFRIVILVIDIALAIWIFSAYRKAQDSAPTAGSTAKTTAATTKAPSTKTPSQTTKAPSTKTSSQTTKAPAPATQAPTTASPTETPAALPSVPAAAQPYLDRFSWYLDGVITQGVPEGAKRVDSVSALLGRWQVLLICDPDGPQEKLVFADARADAGQFNYLIIYEKTLTYVPADGSTQEHFETESPAYPFEWENGLATVQAEGSTLSLYCYEWNGRLYGTGAFALPDGTAVYAAAMQEVQR